jgi:toxin ParE1/3/4
MRVRYTSTALLEIVDILTYIADDSRRAAARVSAEIETTVERLRRYPLSSTRDADEGDTRVARVGHYPYLIFYAVEGDEVVMLQVRHGARQQP